MGLGLAKSGHQEHLDEHIEPETDSLSTCAYEFDNAILDSQREWLVLVLRVLCVLVLHWLLRTS